MRQLKLAIFRGPRGWKVITPEGEVMIFNTMVAAMAEAYALGNGETTDLESALSSL